MCVWVGGGGGGEGGICLCTLGSACVLFPPYPTPPHTFSRRSQTFPPNPHPPPPPPPPPSMRVCRWVNCLLLRELPFDLGIRLWDTYLAEG